MVRKAYADTPRRLGIIYNAQSGRHRRRWGHHPLPVDVPAIEANTVEEIWAPTGTAGDISANHYLTLQVELAGTGVAMGTLVVMVDYRVQE